MPRMRIEEYLPQEEVKSNDEKNENTGFREYMQQTLRIFKEECKQIYQAIEECVILYFFTLYNLKRLGFLKI